MSKGFDVEKLKEIKDKKTADLMVTSKNQSFIIEIKSRREDPGRIETERKALEQGQIVERSETTTRTNTISGIVQEGVDQLSRYPQRANQYRLLWLHAEGHDVELQKDQIKGTLYGTSDIFDLSGTTGNKECLYFYYNDFYRFSDLLDAAIIGTYQDAQLCLNTFSPKIDEFRKSTLAKAFVQGTYDPEVHENSGNIYVADCDYNRKEERLILNYIKNKYSNDRLICIHMKNHKAFMQIPKP